MRWPVKYLFIAIGLCQMGGTQHPGGTQYPGGTQHTGGSQHPSGAPKTTHATPPNIILIVADDLGYSDLSSYGNAYVHTPNIDSLGTRFTDALVTAPICGPSRAALLTGRYQQRFGYEYMPFEQLAPGVQKDMKRYYTSLHKRNNEGLNHFHPHIWIKSSKYDTQLPATEITIAQLLKQKGYVTGLVGKWNLGDGPGAYPDQRGYDYSYYFTGALTRYVDETVDSSGYVYQHLPWAFSEASAWAPRYGATAIREGRQIVIDTGYSTFSFARKSIDFIERNATHPFFLTLTFNAPHDPFQAPKAYYNKIQGVTDPVKKVYYAMIEALDDAVGMVIQALKNQQLDQNTLIIFISDNGGATYTRATDNAPLKGGKCTHFEGGLEVPMFIRYPGLKKAPSLCPTAVSSLDIFATIAHAAGASLPADRVYDGVDLYPYLNGNNTDSLHHVFYWRNGYSKAIRKDQWKLYINDKNHQVLLYNFEKDRQERTDMSHQYPAKVQELKQLLKDWEAHNTVPPLWPSRGNVSILIDNEYLDFPV
jgi:arylsulfatase A-like enzyme